MNKYHKLVLMAYDNVASCRQLCTASFATTICSARCSVLRILLASFTTCLFICVIVLFFDGRIFRSAVKLNTVHVRKAGLVLVVHGYGQGVWKKSNCGTGNIYCTHSGSIGNVVTDNSRNLGHISSNKTTSSLNTSLVLLDKLQTKSNESLKLVNDRASSLSHDMNRTLFHSHELVIWSTDHHPAPAYDAKYFLRPLGVRLLQHDLSPYCSFFNLCAQQHSLKVLNAANMFDLDPALIPRFYQAYKNDPVMQSVDAFLCYDPPAICQLYEPFNKSLIVIASNRYYITRQSTERWTAWNKMLIRYASDPRNVVAANNHYDVEMIQYFTGLKVKWIPNFAGYTGTTYNPTRQGFLLSKRRIDAEFEWLFLSQFNEACKSLNRSLPIPELIRIKGRYSYYKYADLAAHQGIVHLPYQVSTMSIFEQYRMNIPLFFPSKELLLQWSLDRWVVRERTLPWLVRDPRPFTMPPHPSQRHVPSPNDNDDAEAVKYWLQFADYYTLPHITYFNSTEHLAVILQKLTVDDLKTISWKMKKFNEQFREELLSTWTRILQTVAKFSPNHPH